MTVWRTYNRDKTEAERLRREATAVEKYGTKIGINTAFCFRTEADKLMSRGRK
jgi:hypothetical protein